MTELKKATCVTNIEIYGLKCFEVVNKYFLELYQQKNVEKQMRRYLKGQVLSKLETYLSTNRFQF